MSINNLPSSLASVIQAGFLEREFRDALRARLGFRAIADREPFPAHIGETITKTRRGLLAAATTPIGAAANTDITSGLTAKNYGVEQYVLGVNQYADQMSLNVVTSRVGIVDQFLQQASALGEQAARTVNVLAQQAIFNAYMGGNTRVITTLGAPAATIHVDDIRGFQTTLNTSGQPVAVSGSFPVTVTVGADAYSLTGFAADGSNISTTPGGVSGTLTFSGNVTVADATAGNSVISAVAPAIIRPSNSSTGVMASNTTLIATASDYNAAQLTTQMLLQAKAQLALNGVPPLEDGRYICYADPAHLVGIYQDQAFQRFLATRDTSSEYRQGVIGELLGIRIVETNLNPVQTAVNGSGGFAFTGQVRRAIVCGKGALVEGEFTREGYSAVNAVDSDPMITMVDGIAHIVREPLDALKQVVFSSWSYIGGFCVPTDTTANPTVLPTATNAAYKRAVILESI